MVIMSKKKAYVWFFRAQGEFLVLVMKEASISIFSLNVTSVWRRKKKIQEKFYSRFPAQWKTIWIVVSCEFLKNKVFQTVLELILTKICIYFQK